MKKPANDKQSVGLPGRQRDFLRKTEKALEEDRVGLKETEEWLGEWLGLVRDSIKARERLKQAEERLAGARAAQLKTYLGYKNRPYDLTDQKIELLYRCDSFLADKEKVSQCFAFYRRWHEIEERLAAEIRSKGQVPIYPIPETQELALAEFGWPSIPRDQWQWFFKKWEIKDGWSGEKYGVDPLGLYFSLDVGPRMRAYAKDRRQNYGMDVREEHPYPGHVGYGRKSSVRRPQLLITVDPWTTQRDIIKLCKRLPEMKRLAFGFAAESKSFFARDLCWYDLQRHLHLPQVLIASCWAKARPDDLLDLVKKTKDWKAASDQDRGAVKADYIACGLPSVVGAAIDRIQKAIDYLTL